MNNVRIDNNQNKRFLSLCLYLIVLFNLVYGSEYDTLAVTPFEVIGDIENTDLFAYGLAESIANDLSQIPNIVIIERLRLSKVLQELSLSQAGIVSEKNAHHVGQLCKVNTILIGSVEKLGEQISTQVRAIRVSSGKVLFSVKAIYRVNDLTDLFELSSDLSRKILKKLLPSEEEKSFNELAEIRVPSDIAFNHYIRGIKLFDNGDIVSGNIELDKSADESFDWADKIRTNSQAAFDELDKEIKQQKKK